MFLTPLMIKPHQFEYRSVYKSCTFKLKNLNLTGLKVKYNLKVLLSKYQNVGTNLKNKYNLLRKWTYIKMKPPKTSLYVWVIDQA